VATLEAVDPVELALYAEQAGLPVSATIVLTAPTMRAMGGAR